MGQDLLFELLQLQSRVETQLVGQPVPRPPICRQCIGLAAVAVQGDHQQCPQSFALRLHTHERFEFAGHIAGGAQLEAGGELILDEPETDLFETGAVGDDPVGVTRAREDVPFEQGERRRGRLHRRSRVACSSER